MLIPCAQDEADIAEAEESDLTPLSDEEDTKVEKVTRKLKRKVRSQLLLLPA